MPSNCLKRLPVISREKLVQMQIDDPPYAGLGNPDAEIDRIFTSPGPVYEPHLSESDPIWARAYRAAGFGPGDVVLNAFSYHLVAAGSHVPQRTQACRGDGRPVGCVGHGHPGPTHPRSQGDGIHRDAEFPQGDHREGRGDGSRLQEGFPCPEGFLCGGAPSSGPERGVREAVRD